MKELWIKFKDGVTLEKLIVRLIMSWILAAFLFYLKSSIGFNSAEYASSVNIGMYCCFTVLFFVSFCAFGMVKGLGWIETYGPIVLITIYGTATLNKNTDVTYLVGIMVAMLLAIVYAMGKTRKFIDIKSKRIVLITYVLGVAVYIAIAGLTTVYRYLCYNSPCYDFGIWTQMFHYMKTSFAPMTTVERDGLLSHFAVHFSPIYYIYLPIYFVFPYAITLQILQVVTLASGFIPVYLLCRRFELSKSATAAFGILFALFPALSTGCFYDLHENCFLVPLLLWLFYFIEKDSTKGIFIFAALVMLVKEDAPVYTACIALYMIFSNKNSKKGLALLIASVAYFTVVTLMLKIFGLGIMSVRYQNFMGEGEGGLFDVIRNIFTNPAYFVSECFNPKKLEFLLYMLLPLGFLPLATSKISKFVLLIPMILINLATAYQWQYSIFFQYVFGSLAILMYLAISNYADLAKKVRWFLCAVAICSSIVVMPLSTTSRLDYIKTYNDNKAIYTEMDSVLKTIPRDASVKASRFLVAHLSDVDELYSDTNYYHNVQTDYIVIDQRSKNVTELEKAIYQKNGYIEKVNKKGIIAVFKKL